MPSRIIRDGWLESERINALKPEEECFYLRLCLRADDFGRYHANPVLLKSNLFPLRENVRSTDIPRWLAACQKAGLVRCYEADAKPFLEIVKFGQRIKEGLRSKFPPPPDIAGQIPEVPGSSRQIPANPGKAGTFPPYSEAKADSKSETKPGAPAALEVVFPLTLNSPEFSEAWTNWAQHRREIKKPITPTAQKEQLKKLEEMGLQRAIAALRHSTANQYQGVFEPDPKPGSAQPATPARVNIA